MKPIKFSGIVKYKWINLVLINKKKKTSHLVDLAVLSDHRVKMKENQKILRSCHLLSHLRFLISSHINPKREYLYRIYALLIIYLYTDKILSHSPDHHHHHVTLPGWISLTFSHHPSLSSIALARSSRLYPVSTQSCCI